LLHKLVEVKKSLQSQKPKSQVDFTTAYEQLSRSEKHEVDSMR
jgi:hypothetical protein